MRTFRTLFLLMLSTSVACAEVSENAEEKPDGNKAKATAQSWRFRYELGAGDVLNFSLYGRPELDRPNFKIAPDGTVSYLQAQNIKVSGMTIDEARVIIEKALESNFKKPRVIITPSQIASKRFTILGKVVKRGVVTLERPTSLVEAVANAGGVETGLYQKNTVELADYDRSFVSRGGKRLDIDFKRLFQDADMTQNIEIEPNDFIYLASTLANDYYVIGAVQNPGIQGFSANTTVVTAISQRGGFTDRAWKDRVLVVRGSLSEPKTYVVSMKDILSAEGLNFRIQPKDIVYVAEHPWVEVQDILEIALSAFTTSASSTWINLNLQDEE